MGNSFSIQSDMIFFVAIIAVLVALFFVFVKIIQLLNELTKTVVISQDTLTKTNTLIDNTDNSLKQVEEIVVDVNRQYFEVSSTIDNVKSQATNFVTKLFNKNNVEESEANE